MFRGNPNTPANPYAPQHYDRAPFQPGATNPYGYGYQRTAGQLAPQVHYQPYHQSNTGPQARIISDPPQMQPNPRLMPPMTNPTQGIYARPNYPNALGYGGRPTPGPNVYHPLNAPGPSSITDLLRRLGY